MSDERVVDLQIDGMTCASCAARIEKKLNRLEGVTASVNYATEQAHVTASSEVSDDRLVQTVEALGYGASLPQPLVEDTTEAEAADPLRERLLVSLALTLPVVALSMLSFLQFDDWQWLALTLAAPVAVWGAWPFHRAAWVNARHGATTMDTLISIGVIAAFGWSLYALFLGGAGEPGMHMGITLIGGQTDAADEIYLEVAAGVTCFVLAGRYLEARAKRRSGAALRALLDLGAKHAVVRRDGRETVVPADSLQVGDAFVVRPGEQVATDGVVLEGTSAVDNSLVTGESVPVEVGPGDAVVGASMNAGGRIVVEATRVGKDTQLARIAQLVQQAQQSKAPVQRLADRISAVFVPAVLALSLLTLVAWLVSGATPTTAFSAAVAVLIIACPCALGLATPTALLVGTGRGAQLGILIKGPEVLESTRRIDTIVLDKTGTVTTGHMSVVDVVAVAEATSDDVLARAGAVEHASEHPIARAVAEAAARRGALPDAVERFRSTSGLGVEASVDGTDVLVGRLPWLSERGLVVPEDVRAHAAGAEASGLTVVAVAWEGRTQGLVTVADSVKPSSPSAISQLRRLGLRPLLLTGDNRATAAAVAAQVGIADADVLAEVSPADKAAQVRTLQESGAVVAVVGDGVNDAAALAQADLGIAMGTGTDVAIEASELTLVRGDLVAAPQAIELSRRVLRTIKGNLFWAFAYNVAAIPLAAFGLLNPLLAGLAMALSSLFVVSNSLRLRRFRPHG